MPVATKRESASVRSISRSKATVVKDEPKKADVVKVAAKLKVARGELAKPVKTRLVRDSFTMPEDEYAILSASKKACLKAGVEVKKT